MRRAVWSMLHADDSGGVSKSAERLAKMMTVVVTVFDSAGFTVSEQRTDKMPLQTRDLASRALPFVVEAAGHWYKQTTQFPYLGGLVHEDADLMVEIK